MWLNKSCLTLFGLVVDGFVDYSRDAFSPIISPEVSSPEQCILEEKKEVDY